MLASSLATAKVLLLDPRLFSYTIMVLYALNIVRWAIAGKYADAAYWMGALWITLVVTFLYDH